MRTPTPHAREIFNSLLQKALIPGVFCSVPAVNEPAQWVLQREAARITIDLEKQQLRIHGLADNVVPPYLGQNWQRRLVEDALVALGLLVDGTHTQSRW